MEQKLNKNLLRCDLFAGAVWCVLFIWLFNRIPHMPILTDEGMLVYVLRFMQGYAPFVDDWGAEQLAALFQYLPYRLYLLATGSSDGAFLFMRYCYLAVCAVLFWYLYLKLRDRGFWGLLAAILFSTYIPLAFPTLNYYTMHVQGLAVFCAVLFLSEKEPRPLQTVFAGIVFACVVMIEPPLAALYLLFSLLVLLRIFVRKRGKQTLSSYAFILCEKTWLYLTLGVVVCFTLFVIWVSCTGGLFNTIKALPLFFKNLGYDMVDENETRLSYYYLMYLKPVIKGIRMIFGRSFFFVFPGFVIAAVFCRYKAKGTNAKQIVFLSSLIYFGGLLVFNTVRFLPFIGNPDNKPYWPHYFNVIPTVPLLCLGLIWHILRQNKNQKLFCVWCVGAAASIFVDAVSEMTACVSFAAAMPAVALMLPEVVADLRTLPTALHSRKSYAAAKFPNDSIQRYFPVGVAIITTIFCVSSVVQVYLYGYFGIIGHTEECQNRIEAGVYRGLYVDSARSTAYPKMLADLRKLPPNAQLHITNNSAELYFDAGCMVSVCDPWYYADESYKRQVDWWKLHPDRIPNYIYIPRYWYAAEDPDWSDESYLNTIFEFYDKNFIYQKEYGEGGIMLKIISFLTNK